MTFVTQSAKVRRVSDVYVDDVSRFDDPKYKESFDSIASKQ